MFTLRVWNLGQIETLTDKRLYWYWVTKKLLPKVAVELETQTWAMVSWRVENIHANAQIDSFQANMFISGKKCSSSFEIKLQMERHLKCLRLEYVTELAYVYVWRISKKLPEWHL